MREIAHICAHVHVEPCILVQYVMQFQSIVHGNNCISQYTVDVAFSFTHYIGNANNS